MQPASERQVCARRESLNALGVLRCLNVGDEKQPKYIMATCVIDFALFWSAFSALSVNFLRIIDQLSIESQSFMSNGCRMVNSTEILDQLLARMQCDDPANWSET